MFVSDFSGEIIYFIQIFALIDNWNRSFFYASITGTDHLLCIGSREGPFIMLLSYANARFFWPHFGLLLVALLSVCDSDSVSDWVRACVLTLSRVFPRCRAVPLSARALTF